MRALVTGGAGFLGSALVRTLRAQGHSVHVVGRRRYPEIEALGATGFVCDLGAPDAVTILLPALEGVEVVFHTAAKPPEFAPFDVFFRTNVLGTRALLQAMRQAGTPRLVHTSTPSVVHQGGDIAGLSEAQCPIATHFETPYAQTKATAEREVLDAHSPELATLALRPHLLYGPGEPHMLPRLLERHRKGRLRIVGDGTNLVGLTYIDNAVHAHILAAQALAQPGHPAQGRAFFHHDAEPVNLWSWINAFLTGVGERPLTKRVSRGTARCVGRLAEQTWRMLALSGEPPMTAFVASQLSTSHYFDLSAIHQDLGATDLVCGEDGLARTLQAFRESP